MAVYSSDFADSNYLSRPELFLIGAVLHLSTRFALSHSDAKIFCGQHKVKTRCILMTGAAAGDARLLNGARAPVLHLPLLF